MLTAAVFVIATAVAQQPQELLYPTRSESEAKNAQLVDPPLCLRVACTTECFRVQVEYVEPFEGPPTVGGDFGKLDDGRCYIERNINQKGIWLAHPDGNLTNLPPHRVARMRVVRTAP